MSTTTILLAAIIVFLLMLVGIILTVQEFGELQKHAVRNDSEPRGKAAAIDQHKTRKA